MKQWKSQKSLTREQYLKRFSRAVHWRLPPRESEEAIADYREMLFQKERDESRLAEELGDPVQAASLLVDEKTYSRWRMVFAVLVFVLLLLFKWDWMAHIDYDIPFIGSDERAPVRVMMIGMVLSLYWFRKHGQKNSSISRLLPLTLVIVLAAGCGIMYGWWQITEKGISGQVPDSDQQFIYQIDLVIKVMMYVGMICALVAFGALVLAQCRDRRWLALYVLCVTVAAMCGFVLLQLKNLNVDGPDGWYIFREGCNFRLIPIGAIGLIGTGVALY